MLHVLTRRVTRICENRRVLRGSLIFSKGLGPAFGDMIQPAKYDVCEPLDVYATDGSAIVHDCKMRCGHFVPSSFFTALLSLSTHKSTSCSRVTHISREKSRIIDLQPTNQPTAGNINRAVSGNFYLFKRGAASFLLRPDVADRAMCH